MKDLLGLLEANLFYQAPPPMVKHEVLEADPFVHFGQLKDFAKEFICTLILPYVLCRRGQ